ncbi:unnamed protein product [Cylindrotheca closterium]|uniref:Uncharacterized protein n=1 Tax=Cylindrotheca closterium TaxID=2856 RepID=A0AAD2JKP8_9STRA|nr:unnamed protein product [Cylindrotheca closterium]
MNSTFNNNADENPQSSEGTYDGGSEGYECEIRQEDQPCHDQLPNVESYKAMMGIHRTKPSNKKAAGMIQTKIIEKLAKRIPATEIDKTDTSRRSMDPPEQYPDDWGGLMKDPSGETFTDDYYDEEDEGQRPDLVRNHTDDNDLESYSKPDHLSSTRIHQLCWRLCLLITISVLLAALGFAVIMMTSNMNGWSEGGNSDVRTGGFVQGETQQYLKVRNYLLNIGKLPYNRTYDNYDPDSIEAVQTTSEPQPLSRRELLFNDTSPQYLAAQWLAHGDDSFMPVPTNNQKGYNQRYAMAVIYFALGGKEWFRNYNFLSAGHICTWKEEYNLQAIAEASKSGINTELATLLGVHNNDDWKSSIGSSDQTIIHGVHDCVNDAEGNFFPKALYLPHNNLNGRIPDEIGILNELELLNVEFNPLVRGKLTGHLQELKYLRHLGLQFCNHEGHIPMWIPGLSQLQFLGLGANRFDGDIPYDIGLLSNLKVLGLDNMNVHGDLGMFAALSNLETLYLENTFIHGGISSVLLELWPKLVEIDVSSCDLTGTLPADLWDGVFPSLKVLDLHGNKIEGPIPSPPPQNLMSGESWELEYLALNQNQFTGMVPEKIAAFGKLKHLDISENSLSFQLPEKLGELTNLEYLIVGNNQFVESEVPKFLIELTELRELSVGQTNLVGTIPAFLEYLSHLEILDLHNNGLFGTLPTELSSLIELRHLILKGNDLSGDFPSQQLSELSHLEVLLVEQNQFHGTADAICDSDGGIAEFVADCGANDPSGSTRHRIGSNSTIPTRDGAVGDLIGGNFPSPDQTGIITCPCCSICCNVGDTSCHNWVRQEHMDTIWKYGYKKRRYSYYL